MVGSTILHFEVLERIGEGGMGTVYRARDTRTGRLVALKTLDASRARDPEARDRFLRGSRAQAKLSHPNIATFHDVGESQDTLFIAMELVSGSTLDDYLKAHELTILDALRFALQIGEALASAHHEDVIHRDVSPANVLIADDGRVKLTDFGLARFKDVSTITKTGTIMGTPHYIAPEQAAGEKVDRRADLWSLGVILYEMICHQRPFTGDRADLVLNNVLHSNPQPPARYCRDLSAGLERIILKALSKKPVERYQSADDFVADIRREIHELEEPGATDWVRQDRHRTKTLRNGVVLIALLAVLFTVGKLTGLIEWPSRQGVRYARIAVLPFQFLGPSEMEYIADGFTEELTSQLARIPDIRVISRTSAMQYKNHPKNIREVAEELNVDYVLEGSIQWQSLHDIDTFRISPQLIKAPTDEHVWAQEYDRPVGQLLALQTQIADSVIAALASVLNLTASVTPTRFSTNNPDAFSAYLRGNQYFNRGFRKEDLLSALDLYEQAVATDPDFAMAYARMSRVHSTLYWFRHDQSPERKSLALEDADTALKLAPQLAESHLAMAFYHYWCELDYEKALLELKIVRELEPSNGDLYLASAAIARRQGDFTLAVDQLRRAIDLDPLSTIKVFELGNTFYHMRVCDSAGFYLRHAIELAPDMVAAHSRRILNALSCDGETQRARAYLEEAVQRVSAYYFAVLKYHLDRIDGNYAKALTHLSIDRQDSASYYLASAHIHRLLHDMDKARAEADTALGILKQRVALSPDNSDLRMSLALALAGSGHKDEALAEGRAAASQQPMTVDAFRAPYFLEDLAGIYTLVGESDLAIGILDTLLSVPSTVAVPRLKSDPAWMSLRENPKFEELLRKHGG